MTDGQERRPASVTCAVSDICSNMIFLEEKGGPEEQDSFKRLLDSAFRFRRASGAVVNKEEFIDNLPKGAGQGRMLTGEIDVVYYDNMAVAVLLVDVKGTMFRNARVFLRGGELGWRLVSWCNEKVS